MTGDAPPAPATSRPEEAEAPASEAPEPPPGRNRTRLRGIKVWARFLRIRIAHAVLLPDLTPQEAQDLRKSVHEDSALTSGYILMCALSAGIATLGLLQSSTAVVIGAMLISPLMNPIAALGFGFASIDGHRIRDAVRVVIVGAVIGILTGMVITWLSPIRNATPEILARTQPTLLDLAVALFSGIAGGYATVIGRGGTAIGVAIATALMPPLATLGYGLGVLQMRFALGAALLFLTNLAAIAFAFALIARLSGVARPLRAIEWTPRYIAVLIAAFLALATPLSLTLIRLKHEATMQSAARSAILKATGSNSSRIAQLDVSWPLFDNPRVEAVVITPTYASNALREAEKSLAEEMGETVTINLQQVLAADVQSQTRAMVDAAMERTVAGITGDVPPFDKIRSRIGLPTRSIWSNRTGRMVYVEPAEAPDWTLADYRMAEQQATDADDVWTVRLIPPAKSQLRVPLGESLGESPGESPGGSGDGSGRNSPLVPADLAIWALQRWGMSRVIVTAPEGDATNALVKSLGEAGLTVTRGDLPEASGSRQGETDEPVAVIRVYAPSPTRLAREAARVKAEAEAKGEARPEQESRP